MKSLWHLLPLLSFVALADAAAVESPDRYEAEEDWGAALGAYLEILDRSPRNAAARKGAWRAAMRLGLPEQAAELGASLDERERADMESDLIALEIRNGRIDAASLEGPERFRRLDEAIARTDELAAGLFAGREPDAVSTRRLVDRVSGLAARGRPADVAKLYEALQAKGIAVPPWALSNVADAYLTLRKPRTAEPLYRKVLAESPDDFDANLGLFYALVDLERQDEAAAHIDAFAARIPARRRRDNLPNGARLSAQAASDQARIYADRPAEAERRIARRVEQMPFNGEVRNSEASLHFARGWPREGEADLRRNLGSDPRNAAIHADRAEALLGLQRWEEGKNELAVAQGLDPANGTVRRATESYALRERPELYIDGAYGHGQPSDPHGSRDYRVDAWLYSGPLAERWRVFAHRYGARADFDDAVTRWTRTGAGAEWRSGDWRATAEANGGGDAKTGLLASMRWQADDFWRVYGSAETVANEVPLQAVRAGLSAKRATLGVDWRANESRKLALAVDATGFSEGNQRRGATASWVERWVSGPRWIVETTLGADAVQNSLGYSAAYFNPPRAHSAWLGGAFDYLTWREYDRSFKQRVTVTVGDYWQSGFGDGSTKSIEYQHRWELRRDLSLSYSIGRLVRPYDGVQEPRNLATLTVLWRF